MADSSSSTSLTTPASTHLDDIPPRTPLAVRRLNAEEQPNPDDAEIEYLCRSVSSQRAELDNLRLQIAMSSPQPVSLQPKGIPLLNTQGNSLGNSESFPVLTTQGIPPVSQRELHPVLTTQGAGNVSSAAASQFLFGKSLAAEFADSFPELNPQGLDLQPVIRTNPVLTTQGEDRSTEGSSRDYFINREISSARVHYTPPELGSSVLTNSRPELITQGTFGATRIPNSKGPTLRGYPGSFPAVRLSPRC